MMVIFDYNIWMMVIMGLYAYYNVGPPVINWFINPSNYSYKYHKP